MNNRTKVLIPTILFFIAAIADIWGIITNNEILKNSAKPMLLTLLAILYLVSVKKPLFWYVLGMFFCFVGDVLLIFEDANFFMFGLGAFLVAHLIYVKVILRFISNTFTLKTLTSILPFVLFFGILMVLIATNLGGMIVPVVAYGIAISAFGTVALLNYRKEQSTENLWLLIGAILFIFSDSLIAVDKFYQPNEIYGVSIMITYILAQFLICKAMIVKTNNL